MGVMKVTPPKWHQVYQGDEEARFFKALVRHPKYEWRSTSALSKESGLTLRRVEEIINKYLKSNMIFQSSKNEDMWAYWERVPELVPIRTKSIAQQDQGDRIDGASCSAKWDFQTALGGDTIREKYKNQYVEVCVENVILRQSIKNKLPCVGFAPDNEDIFYPTRPAPDVPVETLPGAQDLCS